VPASRPRPLVPADLDLTDLDRFADGFPHAAFARLRALGPVLWHEPTGHTPDDEGFWSVVTHAESLEVMHDPDRYSSETGGDRPYGGTLIADSAVAGAVLNMMDDPRHNRIRRLVSKGLTPRVIGRLEDDLRRRTITLVDAAVARAADGETIDWLVEVGAEVPLQAICILLGVPEQDRHQLGEWVHHAFDYPEGDNDGLGSTGDAAGKMGAYGQALMAAKRERPTDDMLSVVVHATLEDEDPPRLTPEELSTFFFLLFAAGSDTTRSAGAAGVWALAHDPSQLDRLRADPTLVPTFVEESVRYMSPAAHNRRTATTDSTLAGCEIRAGEKVVFWEASANRDERVFVEPDRFDVGRSPNPHIGFGHGVHHCLGANLARLELRVIAEELRTRVQGIEPAGPVEWTRSNKHNGVRHLPVRLRPA
jgi:cytochrome P450